MNNNDARDFTRKEMLEEGETLLRCEAPDPFVVALVELEGLAGQGSPGGYEIRVGRPDVIFRNRRSTLPSIVVFGPWSGRKYHKAASRFNKLVDDQLA